MRSLALTRLSLGPKRLIYIKINAWIQLSPSYVLCAPNWCGTRAITAIRDSDFLFSGTGNDKGSPTYTDAFNGSNCAWFERKAVEAYQPNHTRYWKERFTKHQAFPQIVQVVETMLVLFPFHYCSGTWFRPDSEYFPCPCQRGTRANTSSRIRFCLADKVGLVPLMGSTILY